MAISMTALASLADTNNVSSYATGSYTPTANSLVVAWVLSSKGSVPDLPTFSGNGLTWVQVATVTFNTIAAARSRLTLFRAMGASPSAGAGTADFGGASQTGCAISVFELAGVDTGGTNGSAAVVQSATNNGDAVGSLTVTLAAFGSSNNGAAAGFATSNNLATNPDTGWTEIHDLTYATPGRSLETQWRADNDTSAVGTPSAGTPDMGGIAIEIKAATAGGGINIPVVVNHLRIQKIGG